MGEWMEEEAEDVRRRVGVVGGFRGVRAMDTTFEMICERCARSPDTPAILDDVEPRADWGRW